MHVFRDGASQRSKLADYSDCRFLCFFSGRLRIHPKDNAPLLLEPLLSGSVELPKMMKRLSAADDDHKFHFHCRCVQLTRAADSAPRCGDDPLKLKKGRNSRDHSNERVRWIPTAITQRFSYNPLPERLFPKASPGTTRAVTWRSPQ